MAEARATAPAGRADERRDAAVQRRALREARSADRARSEEYVAGQRDQRRHDRQTTKRTSTRSGTGRKAARQVKRSATAPITTATTSAAGLLGIALSLVMLYLALTSAETVAQVVRLTRRGVGWLASPKKSIPYGKES